VKNKSEIIAEALLASIRDGFIKDKLPSEQEIARLHKTTPVTASKALNMLRDQKVIVRVPRLGSFVNKEEQAPVNIHFLSATRFPKAMTQEIIKEVRGQFPNRTLNFLTDVGLHEAEAQGCQILQTTTLFPEQYSAHFVPIPKQVHQRLSETRDYFDVFDIHKDNDLRYGLPMLFSPFALVANTPLLAKYASIQNAYDLNLETLLDIQKKAEADGLFLFDRLFCASHLMGIVMSYLVTNKDAGFDSIKQGLQMFWQLYEKTLSAKPEFANGDVVFSVSCRQTLVSKGFFDLPFDWDLLPLPAMNGERITALASLSFFVSNKAEHPGDMFEICEAFLSPAVQKILAKYKYGVPIRQSLVPETLDSSRYRDDIFFNEIKNVALLPDHFSKDMVTAIYGSLDQLNFSEVGMASVLQSLEKIFEVCMSLKAMEKTNRTRLEDLTA